jgi:hypothetical protein
MPATRDLSRAQRRANQRHLNNANAKLPTHLQEIPKDQWPEHPPTDLLHVWRSKKFLVQVFNAPAPALVRMTVNRTAMAATGWKEEISWEDLQRLKLECGYGEQDAVEVFPRQRDIVNVASMRHIWIMVDPLDFIWRKP